MKNSTMIIGTKAGITILLFQMVVTAAGETASHLIVIADTRMIQNPMMQYLAHLYNTSITMYATWSTALSVLYGCLLGWLTDRFMTGIGLDVGYLKPEKYWRNNISQG